MTTTVTTTTTTTSTMATIQDKSKVTCTLNVYNFKLKLKEMLDAFARDPTPSSSYFKFTLMDEKRVSLATLRTHHTSRPESLIFELNSHIISKVHIFRISLLEDGAFGSQPVGHVEIEKNTINNLFEGQLKTDERWRTFVPEEKSDLEDSNVAGDIFFSMSVCSTLSPAPPTTAPLFERALAIGFSGAIAANMLNPAIPFYPSASVTKAPNKVRWSAMKGSREGSKDSTPLHSRSNSSAALFSKLTSKITGTLTGTASALPPKNSISNAVPPTPTVSPTNANSVFLDPHVGKQSIDIDVSKKIPGIGSGKMLMWNVKGPEPKESSTKINAVKSLLTEQLNDSSKMESKMESKSNRMSSMDTSGEYTIPATPACSPANNSEIPRDNLGNQGFFKKQPGGVMTVPQENTSRVPSTPACSPNNNNSIQISAPSDQFTSEVRGCDSLSLRNSGRDSIGSDIPPTPCVSPDFSSEEQGGYLGADGDEHAIESLDSQKSRLFRSISRPFSGLKRGSFPVLPPTFNDDSRKVSDSGCSTGNSSARASKQNSVRSSPKHFARVMRSVSSGNKGAKSNDIKPLRLSAEGGQDIKKRDRRHSRGAKSHIYMLFSPSLKGPVEIVDHDREMFAAIRSVFRFSNELFTDSLQSILQSSKEIPDSYELGNLILRKLTKEEFHNLLNLLPTYVDYVRKNPKTLLPRYYGCVTVQSARLKKKALVVMTNVFHNSLSINRKLNIKCSMKETTITKVIDGTVVEQTIESPDDNLDEQLILPTEIRNETIEQLQSDLIFLKTWQLCEYGLEIGVQYHQKGYSNPIQIAEGYGIRRFFYQPNPELQGSKTKQKTEQKDEGQPTTSKKENGIGGNNQELEKEQVTRGMKDEEQKVGVEKGDAKNELKAKPDAHINLGNKEDIEKKKSEEQNNDSIGNLTPATYVFGLTNCLTRSDVAAATYAQRLTARIDRMICDDMSTKR